MSNTYNAAFWLSLFNIIWINLSLSTDNALFIAANLRNFPTHNKKWTLFASSLLSVALQVGITCVAVKVLEVELLQVVGGCILIWVGVSLLNLNESADAVDASTITNNLNGALFWRTVGTISISNMVLY